MKFGSSRLDRAIAIGVPLAVLGWFIASVGRLGALKTVEGIRVTPKTPPRPGGRGDGPTTGEAPAVPDGPLEGVMVGADEPCELDYGPHRFARGDATGELAAELERWGAGSEPFAVLLTNGEIRELTAGPGGTRSTAGPYERLGTIDLPFAPPGGAPGTGYVLSRSRKNWSVAEAWDAVNPVKNALGGAGLIDAGKAVAALARGRHTVSWVVAAYDPETCTYDVLRVDADPALDALMGRLG